MRHDTIASLKTAASHVWSTRKHGAGQVSEPRSAAAGKIFKIKPYVFLILYIYKQEDSGKVISEKPPIYNSPSRPEYCSSCGMELATAQDMRRHLEQHEACPAENCDFTALTDILERHIEANHITGLYQTVKKVWTPEDIAAWRAERRKK